MPRSDYADLTIILDRSGSMQPIWDDTVGGLQALVDDQKKHPGECRLSLVVFDTSIDRVLDAVPIAEVPPIAEALARFGPRGGTALFDATGQTIVRTGERLRDMPEADRPGRVILAISTDGMNNASVEYSGDRVKSMIEHQESAYSWDVLFMGAGPAAFAGGEAMGVKAGKRLMYASTRSGVAGYTQSLSAAVTMSRGGVEAGFNAEDREKAVMS